MPLLSQIIYLKRLEKGWSQTELAQRAGIPQPNLSGIEKGRDFKVSTLYRLAYAFDVSPVELIQGLKPIALDKKKFFRRDNIEKTVIAITEKKEVPAQWAPAARLIESVVHKKKGYTSKKDLHLSWSIFKKTFSRQEINTILSRLDKAKGRV